jgi:hypothetical protein
VTAIHVYGIIAKNIDHAEWQRRIDNNEVIATTATVIDRQISEYSLITGKNGARTNIVNCSFNYVYKVNGITYSASETYRENADSLCYHKDIVEIKIYYEPKNIGKSISAKMGHEGQVEKLR